MAGQIGGSRPGAGRKPNAVKYEGQLGSFHDRAAEGLGRTYDNLRALADGECVRVETRRQRAGTITRKDVARDAKGEPVRDKNGKLTVIEVQVYPDLPPDEMVVVEEKSIRLPPDFKANELFVDRLGGRPKQGVEVSGEDGGPIPIDLMAAIEKLYPGGGGLEDA